MGKIHIAIQLIAVSACVGVVVGSLLDNYRVMFGCWALLAVIKIIATNKVKQQ
ncbi:hypothetical protein [Celerinatantimonas sp. YJH-8]|uniref:hypothetical protein n=1 Tax=Celerinatantimonas sp. YJH-8 TaxID=3228714 RepID=UPI0038C85152